MKSSATLYIILTDNMLNWLLGVGLTFFPGKLAMWLASSSILPSWFYVILGLGFIVFATWQVVVFLKPWTLNVSALRLAAVLAWGPVLLLTAVLLSPLAQTMYRVSKILLWIGNGYMLVLGMWYWRVAQKQK